MTRRRIDRIVLLLCALLFATSPRPHLHAAEPPAPLAPVPSPAQLAWQQDERALFVNFGMNTFTSRDTGLGNEDPKWFNPARLDCSQWVSVARENGFKGIILTAKHHDGFCLWPTVTTDRSVKQSPWKDGRGDVVRELADACRAAGVRFGLYCAPWDRSQPTYVDDKPAYARIYQAQLTELLSDYGPVYEMWFDGNRADLVGWPAIIDLVRSLQPNTVIKQGPRLPQVREDARWVGNAVASAPLENWSVYPPPNLATNAERIWFPVECNAMLVGNAFWDGTPPRDLPALLNAYYTSVGRNSVLLLNTAPNKEGLFSPETVARLQEFHQALDRIFGTDLASGQSAAASNVRGNDPAFGAARAFDGDRDTYWATDDGVTNAWLEVDLGSPREFNVVRLEEHIALGQRIGEYRLEVLDATGNWRQVNHGFTIGNRKLDRIPNVTGSRVRLTILKSRACPAISSIGVHLDTVSPAAHFDPAFANAEVGAPARAPRQGN